MRTIKIVFIILLATYSGNSILAQSDHLEPTIGIFDCTNSSLEYYGKVKKILFKGLNYNPTIRFLVLPSFSPESVLEIAFDRTTKKFY